MSISKENLADGESNDLQCVHTDIITSSASVALGLFSTTFHL
jgi:hypothetical protein